MTRPKAIKCVTASLLLMAMGGLFLLRQADVARAQTTAEADPAMSPLGKQAAVHVRRDLLAGEPLLPIGPTDDRVRGAEISIRGVVRRIDNDWIVLERARDFAYVPRKSVLVMEVLK